MWLCAVRREIMTFFDLLTAVLLLQPSMSLDFTAVQGHGFVFKLFYTMNPQSCFLFSYFLASVVGRRSMAWLSLLSSGALLLGKELLWWYILHCSIFISMSPSILSPCTKKKKKMAKMISVTCFLMKSCESLLNCSVVMLIKF